MELDTTSFLLEVMNFIVLVWILKRFLYRPILDAIDRRRAGIDRTLKQAAAMQADAGRLQAQYESRLLEWEKEKTAARAALDRDIAELRDRRLAEVEQTARREQERLQVLNDRREEERERDAERRALDHAVAMAGKLLERLAGPALEGKLAEVLAADLAQWPPEQVEKVAAAAQAANGNIAVASAFPIPDALRDTLQRALSGRLGLPCRLQFSTDPSLVAGLRVSIGPWRLLANLGDELAYFNHGATDAL